MEVLCWTREAMEVRRIAARKEVLLTEMLGDMQPLLVPDLPHFLEGLSSCKVPPCLPPPPPPRGERTKSSPRAGVTSPQFLSWHAVGGASRSLGKGSRKQITPRNRFDGLIRSRPIVLWRLSVILLLTTPRDLRFSNIPAIPGNCAFLLLAGTLL
jgi:hypothetical protein